MSQLTTLIDHSFSMSPTSTESQVITYAPTMLIETNIKFQPPLSPSRNGAASTASFPWKLYYLLEQSDEMGHSDIVSWQGPSTFRVHQPKRFEAEILPHYFRQSKYKSFLRQLNIYEFHRIHYGPNKGGYTHTHFIRGSPRLCSQIVRVFVPRKSRPSSTDFNNDEGVSTIKHSNDAIMPVPKSSAPYLTPSMNMQKRLYCHDKVPSSAICDLDDENSGIDAVLHDDGMFTNNYFPGGQVWDGICSEFQDELNIDWNSLDNEQHFDNMTVSPNIFDLEPLSLPALFSAPVPEPEQSVSIMERKTCSPHPSNQDLNRLESLFPTKLHRMLQDANEDKFDDIVSWIHGGSAFKVHNIPRFVSEVMPTYFDQSKYPSFRRQLNLYQFTRTASPLHGTFFSHKFFLQHEPDMCYRIVRQSSSRSR